MNVYGCHNRARERGYWANTRVVADRPLLPTETHRRVVQEQEFIEDHSSRECRYDSRAADPLCYGCSK